MKIKGPQVNSIVALVSHDLLTPLTAIRLELEILLKTVLPNPEKRNSQILENALMSLGSSCGHAISLIRNVLDASALENSVFKLSKKKVWMTGFLEETVNGLIPQAKKNGIELSLKNGTDIEAEIDPDRLRQVFWNLIGNALKVTPSGGRVNITVQETASKIVFQIEDTGPGLSKSQTKDFFNNNYSLKQNNPYSLGLGLFIVRNIVNEHDGEISVSSSPGKGSLVSFTINKP